MTYIILHNIRSAYNVGSIFRTADAAGVSRIYLTGYTPAPVDRFGRKRKDIAKVALGAEESVPWEKTEDSLPIIDFLKKENFEVVAVEQSKRSINYKEFVPKQKTTFIFGNETEGLSQNILEISDVALEIPMKGVKESLNVSVSAGIVLAHYLL